MKLKMVVGMLMLMVLLTSCDAVDERGKPSSKEIANFQQADNITILTDSSTGCQYVLLDQDSNSAKMSPYYNAEGKVNGCGKVSLP